MEWAIANMPEMKVWGLNYVCHFCGYFFQHLLTSFLDQAITVNNSAELDLGLRGPGVVRMAMVTEPWLGECPQGWGVQ